ncbi:RtcB family protein [Limnochorda pilosa]|uniref:3'-phosphate/5'-hydroxy nucleic acid ligase n=1 Tax=Limnochorda pilosa TaxID=1555112 RepID=A0A0K2SGP7_LIMPI|nr:RtcB family protein [Limnochorda pilosa]BAS26197.1 metallophosphatase [Limnochorda pilosa]
MPYQVIDGVRVFGEPEPQALAQAKTCARTGRVAGVALMADHHKGYSQPIGGVVVYEPDQVSPSGVGFDIACGNKAARTPLTLPQIAPDLPRIMDRIWQEISFGIGRKNPRPVEHPVLEHPLWRDEKHLRSLHRMAADQLGTVGGGNHYVDLFVEPPTQRIWVGVHFGSRGPGFRIASGVLNLMRNRPFDDPRTGERMDEPPALLDLETELGRFYWEAMHLAGQFAYAGRDHVVGQVLRILGTQADLEVHNHHNFAWLEEIGGQKAIVVRKGATPNFPAQLSFVGGSMGDISVILRGKESDEARASYRSTVHGAGRLMSRTQAVGKWRRQGGRRVRVGGAVDMEAVRRNLVARGIELRGGGPDEAPAVYRRLQPVLDAHAGSVDILHVLEPIGVAMAGPEVFDPYKD